MPVVAGSVVGAAMGGVAGWAVLGLPYGFAGLVFGGFTGGILGHFIEYEALFEEDQNSAEQIEPYTEKLRNLAVSLLTISLKLENDNLENETYKQQLHRDFERARTLLARINKEIADGVHATEEDFHALEELFTHGSIAPLLTAVAAAANEEAITANDIALIESDDDIDGAAHAEDVGPNRHLRSHEGDMIPSDDEQLKLFQSLSSLQQEGNATLMRAGRSWTNGVVNYCFAPDVSVAMQHLFEAATKDINYAVPCIVFRNVGWSSGTSTDTGFNQRCKAKPAIFVQSNPNEGCYSYVGMIGQWDSQKLQLQEPGCMSIGTAVHELGHAIGMAHEQARPDRGAHVQINLANVAAGMEHNFAINPAGFTGVGYSFASIMHYDAYAFAKDHHIPTIVEKQNPAHTANEVGQRIGLANEDIAQLVAMYRNEGSGCGGNSVSGLGCLDKPDANGNAICRGITACTGATVKNCCGCGGGMKIQCYSNNDCPSTEPLPPPASVNCIVDKSNLFPQPASGCVFTNVCDFDVQWSCPGLACTHRTPHGGFWTTTCGSDRQSQICTPGRCSILKA